MVGPGRRLGKVLSVIGACVNNREQHCSVSQVSAKTSRNGKACHESPNPGVWLDSTGGPASNGGDLPQFTAILAVHVGSVVRCLFWPQVVDVVASKIRDSPPGVAFSSISVRVARHGR